MKHNRYSRVWDRSLAQAIDHESVQIHHLSELTLMEQAGQEVARATSDLAAAFHPDVIIFAAGPGNNGGDALVAARLLANESWSQVVLAVGHAPDHLSPSCQHQWRQLPKDARTLTFSPGALKEFQNQRVLIVDGLLGLGVKGALRPGSFQDALQALSEVKSKAVVAVDLPSGMDADCWSALPILPADVTVTFGAAKPCHLLSPAADACGQLQVCKIGFSDEAIQSLEQSTASGGLYLAERFEDHPFTTLPASAHKYDRGHVLVVGGSEGKMGAPLLAGLAALRTGAGWSSIAAPTGLLSGYAGLPLTLTFESFFNGSSLQPGTLQEFLTGRRVKSVLLGPGTMQQILNEDVLDVLFEWQQQSGGAITFDAGATQGILDLLAGRGWLPHRTLLVPHPGEWRRLGANVPDRVNDLKTARETASCRQFVHLTVVYKSATPLVFSNSERITTTNQSSRWLGKAGSGDVVAGCAAAYLCCGITAEEAFFRAIQSVGDAARLCAKTRHGASIIATDLIEHLGRNK